MSVNQELSTFLKLEEEHSKAILPIESQTKEEAVKSNELLEYYKDGHTSDHAVTRESLYKWAAERCAVLAKGEDEDDESLAQSTDGGDEDQSESEVVEGDESSDEDDEDYWDEEEGHEEDESRGGEDDDDDINVPKVEPDIIGDNTAALGHTPTQSTMLIDPILLLANTQIPNLRQREAEAIAQSKNSSEELEKRVRRVTNELDAERFVSRSLRQLLRTTQIQLVLLKEKYLKTEEETLTAQMGKDELEIKMLESEKAQQAAETKKVEAESKLEMIREAHDIEREMYLSKIKRLSKGKKVDPAACSVDGKGLQAASE